MKLVRDQIQEMVFTDMRSYENESRADQGAVWIRLMIAFEGRWKHGSKASITSERIQCMDDGHTYLTLRYI